MKISAIIPAYNCQNFIQNALDSIANQSTPIDEIIVVDDGSTDNTRDVVTMWDGPVTLIPQSNLGPSAARNRGIENATGDWIAFLDADDQWISDKTTAQLAALKANPQLALIASDMAEINAGGTITVPSMLEKHGLLRTFLDLEGRPLPRALASLMQKNFIPTGTVLVRREVILKAGLFNRNLHYGEDLDLWARIAAKYPITCLPEVHMLRRRHEHNTSRHEISMLLDLIRVNQNIREYAAKQLIEQGMDPDGMVARAQWQAGYWYLFRSQHKKARELFVASLREQFALRTLLHTIVTLTPPKLTAALSRIRTSSTQ